MWNSTGPESWTDKGSEWDSQTENESQSEELTEEELTEEELTEEETDKEIRCDLMLHVIILQHSKC